MVPVPVVHEIFDVRSRVLVDRQLAHELHRGPAFVDGAGELGAGTGLGGNFEEAAFGGREGEEGKEGELHAAGSPDGAGVWWWRAGKLWWGTRGISFRRLIR